MELRLKKFDDDLQVVYGEVYPPNIPDSQGDFMTVIEVRKMAHSFMKGMKVSKVDTNHDNIENDSVVVESFIAREGDPDFIADSWVVGVYVENPVVWKAVKSGELNGFSMEAFVHSKPKVIALEVPEELIGKTAMEQEHEHEFIVTMDDEGTFLGGRTNMIQGHYHEITKGTVTNESDGHAHRYSFVEGLVNE